MGLAVPQSIVSVPVICSSWGWDACMGDKSDKALLLSLLLPERFEWVQCWSSLNTKQRSRMLRWAPQGVRITNFSHIVGSRASHHMMKLWHSILNLRDKRNLPLHLCVKYARNAKSPSGGARSQPEKGEDWVMYKKYISYGEVSSLPENSNTKESSMSGALKTDEGWWFMR